MRILAKLPTSVKIVLKVVLFPFVFIWVTLGMSLFKFGEWISEIGDRMTGYEASKRF